MTAVADDLFARVVNKFEPESRLLRSEMLHGGVSARVTALVVARPDGSIKKLVVRQHGEIDRAHNPHIAADEFRLLGTLRSSGLLAPAPYYLDKSCEILDAPYIVIEYIEGETEFAPADLSGAILQLATQLSGIHKVGCLPFLPKAEQRYANLWHARSPTLDAAYDEERIREMLEAAWPIEQRNAAVLLHGDFWPGNVLWKDGRVAGIVDWEDAQCGDPLADLANTRLEIQLAFGSEAMQEFTQQYLALNSIDRMYLPYWDLCVALRAAPRISQWAAGAGTEERMRAGLGLFIAQAFERIRG